MTEKEAGHYLTQAPGGYPFYLVDENVSGGKKINAQTFMLDFSILTLLPDMYTF